MNVQLINLLGEVSNDVPSITSIRLVFKKVGPIETQLIVNAMKSNTHVTRLRLDSNKLGDRGAQILSELIAKSTTLQELNIASNGIHDDGICSLSDALKQNSSLTSLKINQNYIGSLAAAALGEALKFNNTLRTLNLSCKTLTAIGISSIAKGLRVNKSLTSLHLAGTKCGSDGAATLAEAIRLNQSLRLLDLSDTGIDKEGVALLMTGVKSAIRTSQIRTLCLDHNNLPEELLVRITKLFETISKYRKSKLLPNLESKSNLLASPSSNDTSPVCEVSSSKESSPTKEAKSENENDCEMISPMFTRSKPIPITMVTPITFHRTSTMEEFAEKRSSPASEHKLSVSIPITSPVGSPHSLILISPTAEFRAPPSLQDTQPYEPTTPRTKEPESSS